jgi:aspartate/tyrosine/aromatic aminotransferase
MAASLLSKLMPRGIFLPHRSYRNHLLIFPHGGVPIQFYTYLNEKCELDFDGMTCDIRSAPPGSVILFHVRYIFMFLFFSIYIYMK